jgi:HlyD family secretion protein
MSQIALPNLSVETRSKSRKSMMLAVPVAVAVLAVGGYWYGTRATAPTGDVAGAATFTVLPMDLDVKIGKDGELQAIDSTEIACNVEGQTAIQTLVKEGVTVRKGDILATLDSSAIKQKIEDTTLDLQKAVADLTTAKEMVEIQKLTNAANLEAAQVALLLARLDYQQYTEGTYPAQVKAAETTVEMADITLKNKMQELDQTRDLATKGFVTSADVKADELEVTTSRQALDKAVTDHTVLTKYTHEADLAAKKNAVAQADQKLARTKRENASNLSQRVADQQAKTAALQTLQRRMDRLQEQLAACTIKAPADGIVVYATSNDRNAQSPLQEGTTVRERQALFRLPDTSAMKAVIRIQESQVGKLKVGQRAMVRINGQSLPVGATLSKISVLADSSNRFWNPDLKEYPVELTLDITPPGLKPGMGLTAEVFIERLEDVTAVPVASVYAAGPDNYVFVKEGDFARPVKVTIGDANETHVSVKGPILEGQNVVLLQIGQGRQLLESAGIKTVASAATQPGERRRRNKRPTGPDTPAAAPETPGETTPSPTPAPPAT